MFNLEISDDYDAQVKTLNKASVSSRPFTSTPQHSESFKKRQSSRSICCGSGLLSCFSSATNSPSSKEIQSTKQSQHQNLRPEPPRTRKQVVSISDASNSDELSDLNTQSMATDPFKSLYEDCDLVEQMNSNNKNTAANAKKPLYSLSTGVSKDDSYRADLMQMRRTDFKIIKEVGKGTYGKVYKAQYKNKIYALKELQKQFLLRANKVDAVYRERDMLTRMNSSLNVPKLHFNFQDQHSLYFVMELLQNGSLSQLIKNNYKDNGLFPEDLAKFYAAQLVVMLEELHCNYKVIHRDIKPSNLMIGNDQYLQFIDFGDAQYISEGSLYDRSKTSSAMSKNRKSINDETQSAIYSQGSMSDYFINGMKGKGKKGTFCGTPHYVAPEMIEENKSGTFSDLWALGCILFEMATGNPPFQGKKQAIIFTKIINRQITFPQDMDRDLRNLIDSLMQLNPFDRIGAFGQFHVLKKHPYFEFIDWEKIKSREFAVPMTSLVIAADSRYSTPQKRNPAFNQTELCETSPTNILLIGSDKDMRTSALTTVISMSGDDEESKDDKQEFMAMYTTTNMKSTAANTLNSELVTTHETNSKPVNLLELCDSLAMIAKKDTVILKKFFSKNKERELILLKDRRMVFVKNQQPERCIDFEILIDGECQVSATKDKLVIKSIDQGKQEILCQNPGQWVNAINDLA